MCTSYHVCHEYRNDCLILLMDLVHGCPRVALKLSYERCDDTGHERRLLFTHITFYYIIDIQYRTINMENGVCKIRNTWAPS